MNACYTMRKPDSRIVLFVVLVLVVKVFSVPNEYPEPETTNEKPRVIPPEPLSKIVFVNDIPPGETVQFYFISGAKVYVSSSKDKDAESYEENIHILRPDVDGDYRKMNEVGKRVNSETGEKNPVFEPIHYRIDIRNNNSEKSTYQNSGIIYFLLAADDKYVSNVYESSLFDRRNIFVQSDNIDTRYITLLNPTGAVKISDIHFIEGLTALTVSAGGIEETRSYNFTIHAIGKDAAHTGAPLFFVEPVLTFHKELALFPGSSFEITAKAVELPKEVVIPMNWSDWSFAMSPNYMLKNESSSFKYSFNANANSQFDIQMFGEIAEDSSLKISYDGIEGAGSESFQKKQLERMGKVMRGQTLTVEYQRGLNDTTKGVLVRVECSQSASKLLLYSVFLFIFAQYLF